MCSPQVHTPLEVLARLESFLTLFYKDVVHEDDGVTGNAMLYAWRDAQDSG